MDPLDPPGSTFLKADEVDGPATDPEASAAAKLDKPLDIAEATGIDTVQLQQTDGTSNILGHNTPPPLQRPPLKRESSVPTSQQNSVPLPPRPVDPLEASNPEDSLSLGVLRRIVNEFPKFEPTPYAFVYQDFSNFPEELDELFGYSPEERALLVNTQTAFATHWQSFESAPEVTAHVPGPVPWVDALESKQAAFLTEQAQHVKISPGPRRLQGLQCILYVVLGVWYETAGLVDGPYLSRLGTSTSATHADMADAVQQRYRNSTAQLLAIERGIQLVYQTVGMQAIFDAFRQAYDEHANSEPDATRASELDNVIQCTSRQLWSSTIILYLMTDYAVRSQGERNLTIDRAGVLALRPDLLSYLTEVLADLRWDDSDMLPSLKIFQLYWKTTLLTFGSLPQVEEIKDGLSTEGRVAEKHDERPLITASPLDYHIFRQEITSKYPSFEPRAPLFPFEPDNTSIVPPLQDRDNKPPIVDGPVGPASISGSASSIIHQPVHIATPAPSPPPSPAGPGGKGVKKQNYQTNQMFPLLYPPLEENSNSIGGKGSTEMQDLVGRKWTGRDIPTSILEAAELFANRMRATRAMKQLWQERVRFMKYERGYDANGFSLDDSGNELREPLPEQRSDKDFDSDELPKLDKDLKGRLDNVERFYANSLPQLQSVVIVFMKVILQTVTALVTQPNAPNGLQNGFSSPDQSHQGTNGSTNGDSDEAVDPLLRDLDIMRSQEIMSKAISGTMLVLLKWLKVSHVLKFEYFTQLILDSNYIQLLLKLFTHQEPERLVNYRCERRSLSFLRFCQSQSRHKISRKRNSDPLPPPSSPSSASSSADEAVPPAISRERPESSTADDFPSPPHPLDPLINATPAPYPEVDELGNPLTQQSSEPITSYSWRNFFTLINHVRILQKIVKHKAHRQLLMVQYKYASVLRKNLRVPQSNVRLYTLKCIKGQVPYSHRKWRQGNMRIITAIYLHCRPELRDEWLAGIDVDQEMVEALPHERALRSLTYWHNLRLYPEAMGSGLGESEEGGGLREGEQDFFVRELERMDMVVRERGGAFEGDAANVSAGGNGSGLDIDGMMGDGANGNGNGYGLGDGQRGSNLDAYIM